MRRLPSNCKYAKSCFECPFPDVPPQCLTNFYASDYNDGIYIFRKNLDIQSFPRDKLGEHVEICAVMSEDDGILRMSFYYDKFLMGWLDAGWRSLQRAMRSKSNVYFSVGLEKSLGRKQAYEIIQQCYKYCFGVGNLMSHAIDRFYGDIIARKVKDEISQNEFYAICDRVKLKEGFTLV